MIQRKSGGESGARWLKAELHAHCNLDLADHKFSRHTAEELVDAAAARGYEVLAITCHNRDVWSPELSLYARAAGVTLIPGMEVGVEGRRHLLVYNFHAPPEGLESLQRIRARARPDTLVVAAHPYFPGTRCLNSLLEPNVELFDAIEISGFHVPGLDFNRRARALAARHGKPLVGCGDIHLLWQLDRTFTWIYAEPGIPQVIEAVKQGRVRVESRGLSYLEAARWWATALWRYAVPARRPAPGATSGRTSTRPSNPAAGRAGAARPCP